MKFKLDNYNKYRNNKVEYDGIIFDSKKEAITTELTKPTDKKKIK